MFNCQMNLLQLTTSLWDPGLFIVLWNDDGRPWEEVIMKGPSTRFKVILGLIPFKLNINSPNLIFKASL